ncbi:ATP-binding protein [Dulcicalothrix desertica]|uniref:ATP-binding response regulator n=1 Tax=Dulcicalothrix desertica TaxID=32056 RepID=UPI002278DFB8|nr:ATP-binding protein [Dulcicalothrix desertica]
MGYVSGDSNRLQQIFINLLTNAVKFTPTCGKVEVNLSVNNSSQAEFTVTDTGKGISPEFLPHVFERFRCADSTTTRSKDGLGLGLAIVYNLVELHGGKVTAASPGVGMGTTFTVTLPILTQEAPQLPQTLESPEVSLSGIELLVVDDDKDCCEFLEFTLRNCGGKVKTAASVVEAFATLQDFQPDIIISDISMPEQDGYIFLQNLRSLEAKETKIKIPAIALTANVSEEDKQKAIQAGFQFHLSKPVEPETLLNTIANILTTETQRTQRTQRDF